MRLCWARLARGFSSDPFEVTESAAPCALNTYEAHGLEFGHFSRSRWRAESPQCDSPGWSEHRERRPGKRVVGLFARPEGPEPSTHSRPTSRPLQGGEDIFGIFTWGFASCASPQAVT